jgi:mitochondrial chaperone BCS1
MLDTINHITEAVKANPLLAGMFGLYGVSVIGYIARSVPARIFNTILSQSTTSITLDSTGHWKLSLAFACFGEWFTKRKSAKFSRSFALEYKWDYDDYPGADNPDPARQYALGPGLGLHFFTFENRLFWVRKTEQGASQASVPKYRVVITTLGRSKVPIEKLIAQILPKKDEKELQTFVIGGEGEWKVASSIMKRPLDSVILPEDVKDSMTRTLDEFYAERAWYLDKGLAHKMCVALYGKPGCGKTSFVKALASHYDKNVYILNLNIVSDQTLPVYLSNVPPGSFVLVEDFDTFSVTKSREKKEEEKSDNPFADSHPLTLSGVLNALDGITALDNIVVFLTTNHLDRIDPAMLRDGRTDLKQELRPLTSVEIHKYIEFAYGKNDLYGYNFFDTPGCELHGLLQKHKRNYEGFCTELIKKCGFVNAGCLDRTGTY